MRRPTEMQSLCSSECWGLEQLRVGCWVEMHSHSNQLHVREQRQQMHTICCAQ